MSVKVVTSNTNTKLELEHPVCEKLSVYTGNGGHSSYDDWFSKPMANHA